MSRKSINSVFTPRNQQINESMYVGRPTLEKSLLRSLSKQTNTLIFGESGNGKSWLYKKVLRDANMPYVIANCANAARHDSITKEICCAVLSAVDSHVEIDPNEPLLDAYKLFASGTAQKRIIVLDNLESIFSKPALMEELANIIILLDDARYAKYNVNFLIVGVPNGVLEYFSKTDHLDSVANRLEEMNKVGSLNKDQVKEIVLRGFEQLDVIFTPAQLEKLCDHVFLVTIGIAQRVHEYCEELAFQIEDRQWKYNDALPALADLAWLQKGLRKSYSSIQFHLNSRDTTVARRNQVIYVIGLLKKSQFDSNTIDELIRKYFPETVPPTNMGIGSILSELSTGANPILDRNAKVNEYVVRDPRYLMCIRMMLYLEPISNKVAKRAFSQ